MLWNQKGTDTGFSLFARMAASYGQGSFQSRGQTTFFYQRAGVRPLFQSIAFQFGDRRNEKVL